MNQPIMFSRKISLRPRALAVKFTPIFVFIILWNTLPLLVFDLIKRESGRRPFFIVLFDGTIGHQQPGILKNRSLHHFAFAILR